MNYFNPLEYLITFTFETKMFQIKVIEFKGVHPGWTDYRYILDQIRSRSIFKNRNLYFFYYSIVSRKTLSKTLIKVIPVKFVISFKVLD